VAGDGGGERSACGRDPPKKIKIKKIQVRAACRLLLVDLSGVPGI